MAIPCSLFPIPYFFFFISVFIFALLLICQKHRINNFLIYLIIFSVNKLNTLSIKAAPRFELGDKGFAVLGLTTWLCRRKVRLSILQ